MKLYTITVYDADGEQDGELQSYASGPIPALNEVIEHKHFYADCEFMVQAFGEDPRHFELNGNLRFVRVQVAA